MKNTLSLRCLCLGMALLTTFAVSAQTNMVVLNTTADNILKGAYDPAAYNPASVQRLPDSITQAILRNVNKDSIKAYWTKLGTFYNRNTGNQLSSSTQGITASVNWVNSKFQEFRTKSGNRLTVSNFRFDQNICSRSQHIEPFAVLPGNSTADKSLCIFTAHIDSRTSSSCTASGTVAKGMEDNATGVSIIMELARVMSKYSYTHNIVFLITVGEEQGSNGSKAFANYVHNKGIPVKAVFNNDIVGSIYCQLPVNSPGCTTNNGVDSTSVRIFSGGDINSKSKAWVRYIKLQYREKLMPFVAVPTNVRVMTGIDRDGRSSDHVSFYNLGDISCRLSCANESGDGSGSNGTREHTTSDVGGTDTNNDGVLDNYFVSFTYLQRNAQINGEAIAMAADAPVTPTYTVTNLGNNTLKIVFNSQTGYPKYRVGVRTSSYDFDSVYTFSNLVDTIVRPASSTGYYYVSAASQDANKVESFFGGEVTVTASTVGSGGNGRTIAANNPDLYTDKYDLLQNFPNPFDDATTLTVVVKQKTTGSKGTIRIATMNGSMIKEMPITLNYGNNQVVFTHNYAYTGTLVYSLYVDGQPIATKRMIVAN